MFEFQDPRQRNQAGHDYLGHRYMKEETIELSLKRVSKDLSFEGLTAWMTKSLRKPNLN